MSKLSLEYRQDAEEPSDPMYAPDGGYIPRILFISPDGVVQEQLKNKSGNPKYKYYYSDANQGMLHIHVQHMVGCIYLRGRTCQISSVCFLSVFSFLCAPLLQSVYFFHLLSYQGARLLQFVISMCILYMYHSDPRQGMSHMQVYKLSFGT